MSNPQIDQGTLNRIRASVTWPSNPALNVTAPYLGKEGISISFDGDVTTTIPSLTGVVQSPEPFQQVTMRIHLLRTQSLARAYRTQAESTSLLGVCTVRTDSDSFPPYQFANAAIASVQEMKLDGTDSGWVITVRAIYYINNSLWPS
jgi:hypothetical protein